MPTAADLVPALLNRRLTVFAGAGVSAVAPSCLPSWWQLNHAVLDALAAIGAAATPSAEEVVQKIKAKQDEGRMPPEYTSEVISDTLGEDYFEVLRVVEGERTNAVHQWLAALGAAGRLSTIVTTNFDTLIERAFAERNTPLRVLVKPEDYLHFDIEAHLAHRTSPTVLLKLHGTATDPQTAIDTLAQRKRGFAPPVGVVLRQLLTSTAWCMLGYSGADLDAEPNYLFLRQMAAQGARGLHWLQRSSNAPLPAVSATLAHFGERGHLHTGELPAWLEGWSPSLEGTTVTAPPLPIIEDMSAVRDEAVDDLRDAAQRWAQALGPCPCALVLTNLADRIHPTLADRTAEETLGWASEHALGTRHHGIALMFRARKHRTAGRHIQASQLYAASVQIFESLDAADALSDAYNEYGNLLSAIGRLEEAAQAMRQSIALAEHIGDPEGVAVPSINLAQILARQGSIEEAQAAAQAGLHAARDSGDESTRALALEHLGNLLRDLGDHENALARYKDAEAVRRRLGQDLALGYGLTHQATIHSPAAEFDRARSLLDEAEQIAVRLGNPSLLATVRMTQAGVSTSIGDYLGAIGQLEEAERLRNEAGDPIGGLEVAGNLVGVHATRGNAAAAIEAGTQALALADELGVPGAVADISGNLGLAYEMAGDLETAVVHYERCLTTAREIRNQSAEMNALGNLGNVWYRRQELDEALAHYERSLALARQLADHGVLVRTLANVGNIYMQRQQPDEADARYNEALAIADRYEMAGITGHIHLNQAFVVMGRQDWAAAAGQLARAFEIFEHQGDLANAGMAAFYGGQCIAQEGKVDEARDRIQLALYQWDGLGHPQEADARAWLDQLG